MTLVPSPRHRAFAGVSCLMDVGMVRDGSQWHRPLGNIDHWRFSRWAGVHAHPLRSRSGTPPAVLHRVVDPTSFPSLREDLGHPTRIPISHPQLRDAPRQGRLIHCL